MDSRLGILFAVAGMTTLLPVLRAEEAVSAPTMVWTDPSGSLVWKTATSAELPVSVDWPTGAASATLTAMVGDRTLASAEITDTTVSVWNLHLDPPTTETEECIAELALAFKTSAGAVLDGETRTARLGLVRGTGGNSFRCIPAGADSGKWKSVKKGTAVVPVPEGTTALVLDGQDLAFDGAPGWAYMSGLAAGSHLLTKEDAQGGTTDAPLRVSGEFLLMLK